MSRDDQNAGVAQLVEQRIRNAKVNSSIPFTGTKLFCMAADIGSLTARPWVWSRAFVICSPTTDPYNARDAHPDRE